MSAEFRNLFKSSRYFELTCLYFEVKFSSELQQLGGSSMKSQDIFICPMHPEVRKNDPTVCPKCGMRLELVPPSLDDGENPDRLDEKILDQNIFETQVDVPYANPQRQKPLEPL
jgi:Heavy metal binding domain